MFESDIGPAIAMFMIALFLGVMGTAIYLYFAKDKDGNTFFTKREIVDNSQKEIDTLQL